MIVASLLLVIVAAVTLLIGLFNQDQTTWVYTSIACCLVAGLLLIIGVIRSRPSRKPVLQSGGDGQPASWAGASTWSGADSGDDVLDRDETASGVSIVAPQTSSVDETAQWAPDDSAGDHQAVAEELGAPPVVEAPPGAEAGEPFSPPPAVEEPAAAGEDTGRLDGAASVGAEAEPTSEEVVIPKPSARTADADTDSPPSPSDPVGTAEEERKRIEEALKPIAGVGPTKRNALAERFDTYRKLRNASVERIAEVPGVSKVIAQRIHDELRKR